MFFLVLSYGITPVAGGDHTPLGVFFNAPNLVVWLYYAPKQTLY